MVMRKIKGYASRDRYIESMNRKMQRLESENLALKRDNALLLQSLSAYKEIEKQIKELETQYLNGIHDAHKMLDECRKMITAGRSAQMKYSKEMRGLLKRIE